MKRKSLAVVTAALLATTMAAEPALAQYNGGYNSNSGNSDNNYNRDNGYDRDRDYNQNAPGPSQYDRDRDQYNRDRDAYDRDRDQYDQARASDDWRQHNRSDDSYYRDCQQQKAGNQVGGLIIGAIAGGLLGSTIAHGPARGGGTALGAILGGAIGANVGGNLNCDDRGYVYRTYYDGFERGVPNSTYRWRNARSGNYGTFMVRDYYRDRGGFRCARYHQTIFVHGRPVDADGHACRQRDGNWQIVD